jgi:hypothetical protein
MTTEQTIAAIIHERQDQARLQVLLALHHEVQAIRGALAKMPNGNEPIIELIFLRLNDFQAKQLAKIAADE